MNNSISLPVAGLLDVPICSVNDDGYFASPRYSLQFPPNNFNNTKLSKWKGRIPVNAINVNSQLHPINTITGLQYFMGLNSYPWRERAVPKVGLGELCGMVSVSTATCGMSVSYTHLTLPTT